MRKFLYILSILITVSLSPITSGKDITITPELIKQLKIKDDIINSRFPTYTEQGEWKYSEKPNWLSGFTSGELWNLYEVSKDDDLKVRALRHADNLIKFATLDNTHDLGFMFFPSVVKAYLVTGDTKYRDAAIQAAKMIAKRFNANGNFIRAWGALSSDDRAGLMIIDTMLNLELLFWAAKETGDWTLYDIAYKHALTCMKETVRPDFTSYHVVEFDPQSGAVIKKRTHQGFSDESTWARGQAWGVYGFAIAYKYTSDERFLSTSKKMADVFLSKLPADLVPYWDFDLSGDTVSRDASAAAIAASGMELLSTLVPSATDAKHYKESFGNITESLIQKYSFLNSKRKTEQGLLLHTVYNYAKSWGIDESFPCGDYYFSEVYNKYIKNIKTTHFIQDSPVRSEYKINADWAYLEDDIKNIADVSKSAKDWEAISLPHTWNKSDIYNLTPGYRRAASWYKKEIFIPKLTTDMRFIVSFDAVNIKSEIYVNGIKAGSHVGGYIGFDIDITPYITFDKVNTILVKADNSVDINVIPSQKSDFSIMGGIPRNVYLKVLPLNYIKNFHITTPSVSKEKAKTIVSVDVAGFKSTDEKYLLLVQINDPAGKLISEEDQNITVASAESNFSVTMPDIKNPLLWSPDKPNLYTVNVFLKKQKSTIDKFSDRCGYRWFEFKEKGPFFLNGERLLLRGTHRHEEISGYGNAIPDSLHRKDIQLIKDLGANFIRLAHYPQAPEVYRACDELGIILWDEVPWCRGGVGKDEWKSNVKRLLCEQIYLHYNHPAIVLWSIGNESDWVPDFPDGDNSDSMYTFAKDLNDLVKKLDPYRVTTARKFDAASKVVDVFSPSMWPGWYSTVYKEYDKVITSNRDKYKRMFHAEYGGDNLPGRHTDNPISGEGTIPIDDGQEKSNQVKVKNIASEGDWSESYIVNLFDWYLKSSETSTWLSGSAQWIFRDFSTPLRPENPIPYVNQKGLVDLDGNPKDAYYVFKSYWTKSPKFCYVESHSWKFRSGSKNSKKLVKVFSNCEEVELFINGVSQGKNKKDINIYPASGLFWNVAFAEGENTITAKGFDEGKEVSIDSVIIVYTSQKIDKADNMVFSQKRLPNGNFLITGTIVDAKGKQCSDFNKRVYFSMTSGGKIVNAGGSPTTSSVIEAANGVASIEVKALPLVTNNLEVRTHELKGFYYSITY